VIGEVFGNYRVVAELGKGGMGIVYRAEHVQLGKPAALKVLLPQFSHDASIVQRFFNEARAASAIDHPGIVEVYDFGTHADGRAFIVMALLRGETLQQRLSRGPLPPLEGASLIAQVAAALAAAHARGIVHRDLKPDNIFLVPNELVAGGTQVKILDFGIAKLANEQQAGLKTQTGALMGTPAYMSPEQCMGSADLDHRTDLYSLGCIFFHVLCGRPPFLSDQGTGMMIAAHLRDAAPDPRTLSPQIPPPIAQIVLRLLAKEPAARFQSAIELRGALVAAGAAQPVTRVSAMVDSFGPTMAPPTAALTTSSGSAAELITKPARKSRAPWFVVGGLLAAVGAVGIGVAVSSSSSSPAQAPAPPPPAPPAPPPPPPAAPPVPPPPPPEEACPTGQLRGDDTHGHCCWPNQAWSTPKARCVGAPSCPHGTVAKGETCSAVPVEGVPIIATKPTLTLDKKSYKPGATVLIKFGAAVPSPEKSRAWITAVAAGAPPSTYGEWVFVDDGASTGALKAPDKPGNYEVRLHTEYPTKSTNVVATVPFAVGAEAQLVGEVTPRAQQTFTAPATAKAGSQIVIKFATPMNAAAGEQFWITIVAPDVAEGSYGTWQYLPAAARSIALAAPKDPGAYELRLHANYPTKSYNVVHRQAIRISE
jgi:serine/threonine protein kinase